MKKIAVLSLFVLLLPVCVFSDDPKPVSYVMAATKAQPIQQSEIKVCQLDVKGNIIHCGFFNPASTQPKTAYQERLVFPWQSIDGIRLHQINNINYAYLSDKTTKNIYRCMVDVAAETLSDCDRQLVIKDSMTPKAWQWIPQQMTLFDTIKPAYWYRISYTPFYMWVPKQTLTYAYVTTAALGCQANTDPKAPCPTYVFMLDEKHPGELAQLDGTSIFRWGITTDSNNDHVPMRTPIYNGNDIPTIANQEYVPNDPQLVKWTDSQTYLYFVNQIDRNVWRCKMNDSTGFWEACESVSSGASELPHFTDSMQLRFSEGAVRKAYLTTNDLTNNTTQCDMTTDGKLSTCRPFVFHPNDFTYPHDLVFSGALSFFSASNDIYQCAVNNNQETQTLDDCHATGFTANKTSDNFRDMRSSAGDWSVMTLGTIP